MKIRCSCGNVIIDQTDYLKYKGYLISDTQWFDFWDAIDGAIEQNYKPDKQKEVVCMQLRRQNVFKSLWECTSCGKLYIEDNSGRLMSYTPDTYTYNRTLDRKE